MHMRDQSGQSNKLDKTQCSEYKLDKTSVGDINEKIKLQGYLVISAKKKKKQSLTRPFRKVTETQKYAYIAMYKNCSLKNCLQKWKKENLKYTNISIWMEKELYLWGTELWETATFILDSWNMCVILTKTMHEFCHQYKQRFKKKLVLKLVPTLSLLLLFSLISSKTSPLSFRFPNGETG